MSYDCYCDYEPASVYVASEPKARVTHKCYECGSAIRPGEKYERVFGVWDGAAQVLKTCSGCLDLRRYVAAHVPCFCWEHGNMIDGAVECAQHFGHEAPGLYFGALRRKVMIDRRPRPER